MKTKLLLYLCPFIYLSLSAQVAGPFNPSSFSNVNLPGYSNQWTDITNAGMEDESYATFGNLPGTSDSHTDYLLVKDFGFQIPGGATINGIKVEVECADPHSRTSDFSVRIVKKGSITGDEKAVGTPYPLIDEYLSYGGSADLWGETWNYKYINENQFGVAIAARRNFNDEITTDGRVNDIRITVYYSFVTLPVSLTGFTARLQSKTVLLNWKTASENNINNYKVERSADGRNFIPLTIIQGLNVTDASYFYYDHNPVTGVSYYRLNIRGAAGYQKYSQVISVKYNPENSVTLFPNPSPQGEDLNITNYNNEKLTVYFFNAGGKMLSTVITDTKLLSTETLTRSTGLIYYKITDNKNNILGTGHFLVL